MDTRNDDPRSGSDRNHGYVDQDDELGTARRHEGRQETKAGAESLDAARDQVSSDIDDGSSHGDPGARPTGSGLNDQKPETD